MLLDPPPLPLIAAAPVDVLPVPLVSDPAEAPGPTATLLGLYGSVYMTIPLSTIFPAREMFPDEVALAPLMFPANEAIVPIVVGILPAALTFSIPDVRSSDIP